MVLSRLRLNRSRAATLWAANLYRVHQRLRMAFSAEPRLLFRVEDLPNNAGTQILIQSHIQPNWSAFEEFPVLLTPPEHKVFEPILEVGRRYRFRLLANPTVKKKSPDGRKVRLSLFKDDEQRTWLTRKLAEAGAKPVTFMAMPRGLQHSHKSPQKDERTQAHFAVLFEGILQVTDPAQLNEAIVNGVGSAKGYGFGLLSLAPA